MTEADNLARQLPESEHEDISKILSELTSEFFELYVPTLTAAAYPMYPRLGLADCITVALAREGRLVITDDFELANRISKLDGDVININHIRQLA
jgi:hypothetical protein